MVVAIIVLGAVAEAVAWAVVARRHVSVWVVLAPVLAAEGVVALATGRIQWCPAVSGTVAVLAGLGSGILLFAATRVFLVVVVRVWPAFRRHAEAIYDQRGGLSLPVAVGAALVVVAGEEFFWRGLAQGRLSEAAGLAAGAVATWAGYVAANAPSGSLAIVAGAVVGGAVWGALAWWTHGVLAPLLCHAVWTSSMLAFPPTAAGSRGGPPDRAPDRAPA